MLDKPQLTIRVFSRKLLAFLSAFTPMITLYFYVKDSYPFAVLILIPLSLVVSSIIKWMIYDEECLQYNSEIKLYKSQKMHNKIDALKKLRVGSACFGESGL
jgi:hypothetical protein